PRRWLGEVVAPEATVEPGELIAGIVELQPAGLRRQLAPHPLTGPGKPLEDERVRPVPVRHADVEIDDVHLELLPAPSGQLEERTLPAVGVPAPPQPRVGRQPSPGLVDSLRRPGDVVDDLWRRAPGPRLDLVSPARVATGVLVDHLASDGSLGPAHMTVCVASDMGQ